jgi:hypothetical protein
MATRNVVKMLLQPLDWCYATAKARYMWRMRRTYRRSPLGPVLLLQMGKVGSKSVQAGLEALKLERPIYHSHFLSEERTAQTEKQRRKFFRTERHAYLLRPWLNQFLLGMYRNDPQQRTWKLVTLTREPVGRNISAFFENLDVVEREDGGEYEITSDYYGIEPTIVNVSDVAKLAELFFTRATHDSPLRFFDREIRDIFGIDVIQSGFSIDKGYEIYKANRVELLVIRLESLAEVAVPAFHEFLGIEDFQLINSNIGDKKIYAPLYDAFKKHIVIGSDYATKLYDSDYMRTFYTQDEIRSAKDKWIRHADED